MENVKHGSRKPNVKVNGLVNVEGMKFHDIEGGFGEGKKAMLVKEIANIHGKEFKHINEAINKNRTRFTNNIDIVDLKSVDLIDRDLLKGLGFSNSSIANANNIYLLSERGYSKLLKILEDDVAWEQYEKLVDGYFNMRGQAKRLSTEEMLELQFRYAKEVKEEVKELRDDFTEYKETTPLFTVECKELQALVRKKGVEVLGGKGSQAYIDNSLRGKVYADIQHQLKREFQVTKYEAIKRGQFVTAKEIVANYRVPTGLKEEIIKVNNQIDFKNAI
ncbi:ORF6C domain-containing protein [Clostridium disporicum]|uniref:ORF6C domain-containing protein n=1 Tax=Clostridium disporicum TaxID=84024 RepID=UPI0034A1B232